MLSGNEACQLMQYNTESKRKSPPAGTTPAAQEAGQQHPNSNANVILQIGMPAALMVGCG